jgi:hypothetical protein
LARARTNNFSCHNFLQYANSVHLRPDLTCPARLRSRMMKKPGGFSKGMVSQTKVLSDLWRAVWYYGWAHLRIEMWAPARCLEILGKTLSA